MPTRNGKIANLPNAIREQLNLRLLEGETGRELAAWLNALPEVQSILGTQFNGSPVSEVNLTHWRQGGYLQWLTERECFDSARALAEGDGDLASTGLSAERLLNVLTVRFGQLLMRWDTSTDESISESAAFAQIAKKARILQGISRSVLAIHRLQSKSAVQKLTPASSSSNVTPNPATGESPSDRKEKSESRAAQMAALGAQIKLLNDEETSRTETMLSRAGRSPVPNALSGSIKPANRSHTLFDPSQDLEEILNAV